jgi:hypothetical protein
LHTDRGRTIDHGSLLLHVFSVLFFLVEFFYSHTGILRGDSLALAKCTQSSTQGCRLLLGLHSFIPSLSTADYFLLVIFF